MMVIATVTRQDATQRALVEYNHMVETFAANRADEPFHIRPLPGRARRGEHLLDAHGFPLLHKVLAKDRIAVAEQLTGCTVPGKGMA